MRHELCPVADAQNRNAKGEYPGGILGGIVLIHAVGTAGENDTDVSLGADVVEGSGAGLHLGVHAEITHAARNELVVLSAEIQNQYLLMIHIPSHSFANKSYLSNRNICNILHQITGKIKDEIQIKILQHLQ